MLKHNYGIRKTHGLTVKAKMTHKMAHVEKRVRMNKTKTRSNNEECLKIVSKYNSNQFLKNAS
jgi:hypothetical protein